MSTFASIRVAVVQHAEFEPAGSILSWADRQEVSLSLYAPYRGERLPRVESFDFLILLGGPQSASVETPELVRELALVRSAADAQKTILGLCLGAQIIARALGGSVVPSPQREVGLYPITLHPAAKLADPLFGPMPATFPVFHWHSEMAIPPQGAVVAATSAGCGVQIFAINRRIYGFQCHLETEPAGVELLIAECGEDLSEGGEFISSKEELRALDHEEFETNNSRLSCILDTLCARILLARA